MRCLLPLVLFAVAGCASGFGSGSGGDDPGKGDDPNHPSPWVDEDTDKDGISDADEGRDYEQDSDGDGTPNYVDSDSDGDCLSDAVEAGDADPYTPPRDSDGDGQPDFVDRDSDDDGLSDEDEDLNCNGIADGEESSATNSDTDGDGASDLVEFVANTNPLDPADNPAVHGDFVFEVPYEKNPLPENDDLDFSTDVSQADVVFAMDTTGSMGGEINNLKASVSSLINSIRADIPNTGFGVVGYEDFPYSGYGDGGYGDQPFYLLHRVMTASTSAGIASIQSRVNTYRTRSGADIAESGWEMLFQIATGAGTNKGNANVPSFNPASAYPATPPVGEVTGGIGGVGYRAGSLPIAVWMTDASSHNASYRPASNYYGVSAATSNAAVIGMNALSAKVVGVVSVDGTDPNAITDVNHAVTQTGAVVTPDAWGASGSRPGGCAVGKCCTGLNGAGENPVAGQCPLLFKINGNGSGLGEAVATGIKVLTNFVTLDVGAVTDDDPGDDIDAVEAFVDRVEASLSVGGLCSDGLVAIDTTGDSVLDTFDDVLPGSTVCFRVTPKMNTTVMPSDTAQVFKAKVSVKGDGITDLDSRDLFFIVPPDVAGVVN